MSDEARGRVIVERPDLAAGPDVRGVRWSGPCGGEQSDAAAGQAPGDQSEHRGARPVRPVQVVDNQQDRAVGRGLAQQRECRGRQGQWAARACLAATERETERFLLMLVESAEATLQWQEKLVKS